MAQVARLHAAAIEEEAKNEEAALRWQLQAAKHAAAVAAKQSQKVAVAQCAEAQPRDQLAVPK